MDRCAPSRSSRAINPRPSSASTSGPYSAQADRISEGLPMFFLDRIDAGRQHAKRVKQQDFLDQETVVLGLPGVGSRLPTRSRWRST